MFLDERGDALKAWAWKQLRPRGDAPFKADEEA
jgi:hypothetical protein